jgi:hypothetical protein
MRTSQGQLAQYASCFRESWDDLRLPTQPAQEPHGRPPYPSEETGLTHLLTLNIGCP